MKIRSLLIVVGIMLLSMGAYAYLRSKTTEDPEPGEMGGDSSGYGPVGSGTSENQNIVMNTENFKVSEFACHDGTPVPEGYYSNVSLLMKNLQVLRDYIGLPVFISSGYRTPSWNAKQPGAVKNSYHLRAMAADIKVVGKSPLQVKQAIEQLIETGQMMQGGIGLYPTFVHYDIRGERARW